MLAMFTNLKIGIDLGATFVKMGVVDKNGQISSRLTIPTHQYSINKKHLIEVILNSIYTIISQIHIKEKNILGVGIGVPGPVDSEKGIVHNLTNIKGWENVPLKALLEKKLGFKVSVDNDVHAMTLGEYVFGAGKGANNVVCLTLGTGVGGGIIIDGKLYRGATMCAGEIGHIPINENGPKCNCGGIACLERYIGNRYILENTQRVFGRKIELEDLSRMAKNGNKKAIKIWEDIAIKLAVVLTGVINLLNPDRVIIGGGVSKAGGLILNPLRKEVMKRAMVNQAKHVKIVNAKLGNDAGIIGAALLGGR
jgi:glucokinase